EGAQSTLRVVPVRQRVAAVDNDPDCALLEKSFHRHEKTLAWRDLSAQRSGSIDVAGRPGGQAVRTDVVAAGLAAACIPRIAGCGPDEQVQYGCTVEKLTKAKARDRAGPARRYHSMVSQWFILEPAATQRDTMPLRARRCSGWDD